MVEVATIRWPADEAQRLQLEERGEPRLLVVEADQSPPPVSDPLEDWIRLPAGEQDRRARLETLRQRAQGVKESAPTIDGDGLVRSSQGWVSVPPVEARIAKLLIENLGEVVSRDSLGDAAWPEGPVQRNALDVRILRLRRRIQDIGLVIRTVRSRGYLLEAV